MRQHERAALVLLIAILGAGALLSVLGRAMPAMIGDDGPFVLVQAAPPAVPRSCWLAPTRDIPWPYRTSAASARLVYNTQADEFLALTFQEVSDWTDQYLIGQQLGSDGEPIGEPVAWGEAKLSTRPAIVHDSVTNHYLVARGMWFPTEPTGGEPMRSFLEMQLLRSGLSLVRHPFTLFAVDDQQPAVAHNPDDNEFMVVWRGALPWAALTPPPLPPTVTPTGMPTPTITPTPLATLPTPTARPTLQGAFAQRLRNNGVQLWPVIPLMNFPIPEEESDFQVVYNSQEQEYLVVWAHSGKTPELYGRRLNRNGELLGDVLFLTDAPAVPYRPLLAYNSADNQYLLVWADARAPETRQADVYGRVLSAQGEPQGESFLVRGTENYEVPTAVAYNPVYNEFLVAWDTNVTTLLKPSLQRLSARGVSIEDPISTAGAVFGVGIDTRRGDYLVLHSVGTRVGLLGFEPDCPAATPTPGVGPTPQPLVVKQLQGEILDITPAGDTEAEQWLVGEPPQDDGPADAETVIVSRLTRVDEHLGRAEVGAEVWVTGHEVLGDTLAADEAAVLVRPAVTPMPTATPTAIATWITQVYLPLIHISSPPMYLSVTVEGHVWLEEPGRGLKGASMYAIYGPGPTPPVNPLATATTGVDGYYRMEMRIFNHPETLWVWPELEGYTFVPGISGWYYPRYQELAANFIAYPAGD